MIKTLVVAEKPSVARDFTAALPGAFKQSKDKTSLESDDYVITWAVGHLVGLAEPDAYDPKLKKWRYADLPIVPEKFKLVPNDDRAKKQLSAIHRLMARDDVDQVINACDAGREGELIFAYVYETAKKQKPIQRLWLSSMTRKAIEDAFTRLRPGEEMESLEDAARSRSEADWLVGMNATRAASIRLRAAFDGAVSLGRVQTPTLALVARREEEIRAFVPEPYWLVEAKFAAGGERNYTGRYMGGKRIAEDLAAQIVEDTRGRPGAISKLDKKEESERPQMLYDLTTLQRHANTMHGFSARRTLGAAQKLYEEHKALTYPRTNSRYLTGDMVDEIRPTAELVGYNPPYRKGAEYVVSLDKLPLGRVVDDGKVTDHHAIIPTKSEHDLSRMGADELKVYDLVAKRFLAIFHPDAVFERTRVETTVEEHVFRTSGRVLVVAGWRAVYGEIAQSPDEPADDSGGDQLLPKLEQGEDVETRSVESMRKETQPPRRYTEASLLAAMETAGKEIEEAELREAMKESGIGTPATRASIIERLLSVGYIERDGRALHATEKGIQVIRLLGEHPLTSAGLTGDWERRLGLIERGGDSRPAFMKDIAKFVTDTVVELDKLKGVQIERAKLGPCPVCAREVVENRKGYSCW
ncbi:MAG: DNA topoisomerase 3, partial [Actinomycetota bacterium]|nr:DNA topoisomerase 3 [Actinomycetota bacterium]